MSQEELIESLLWMNAQLITQNEMLIKKLLAISIEPSNIGSALQYEQTNTITPTDHVGKIPWRLQAQRLTEKFKSKKPSDQENFDLGSETIEIKENASQEF